MLKTLRTRYARFIFAHRMRLETFAEIVRQGGDKVFSEKVFDAASRRLSELEKLWQIAVFIQVPITLYLVLLLTGKAANLTLIGIAASGDVREMLVILSAGVGLWLSWIYHQAEHLESLLKAKNAIAARGNEDAELALNVAYGLEAVVLLPPASDFSRGPLHTVILSVVTLAALALILLVLVGQATIHVLTLKQIILHPNFSHFLTVLTIVFVVLCDVIALGWSCFQSILVPYMSNERAAPHSRLTESNPKND